MGNEESSNKWASFNGVEIAFLFVARIGDVLFPCKSVVEAARARARARSRLHFSFCSNFQRECCCIDEKKFACFVYTRHFYA